MADDVRKIEVVPHKEEWAALFDIEAEKLKTIFGDQAINIHHIGSTAIQGIVAKPIVDILIEVKDIHAVNQHNSEMKKLGYIPKGEYGMSGRRFFIKGTETQRTHHVHIFENGDSHVSRHVNFRDYMNLHSDVARAYSKLKQELAEKYPYDIESYMAGKSSFIEEVEMKIIIWKKFIEKDLF
jgi:GrpB-like predicted nucleotidyltransferase (UPF0157 family)